MNKLKWLLLILLLSGCASNDTRTDTVVVDHVLYPDITDISYPAALHLRACEWKKPRVMNQLTPVHGEKWNGRYCSSYTEEERNTSEYLENCRMENPIDTSSNIIFGFDDEGWRCFQENMKAIRNLIKEYRTRLDQVNQQRARWRQRNKDDAAQKNNKKNNNVKNESTSDDS